MMVYGGFYVQYAVWMAERMGLASGKDIVERANNACMKARWMEL
jgi:hypothetical protein